MKKTGFLILFSIGLGYIPAQLPPPASPYSINLIALPGEMNNQVCISGMKYLNGNLYLVSERCPVIFVLNPQTKSITNTISLKVPQAFEMEGMTSYKDRLYTVSEDKAEVYEIDMQTGIARTVGTSVRLPKKSKDGDGMEGIAANEKNNKLYLLRERNVDKTKTEIYTFNIETGSEDTPLSLTYESMIELPLENDNWRYSDICYDSANSRLICLKSNAKGKFRQLFLESIDINGNGSLSAESLKNIAVENLTETARTYKDQGYSTNLEGITIDNTGNIFIVSDNHSGKAKCDQPAKEKTILLLLTNK